MKQHVFDIELHQPVIISQQAATVGAHQCLDYIAGSTLLGLAASKLYPVLSNEDAFSVFHSGTIRFLDALPVENKEISYPVPLNLHVFKGEKYTQDNQVLKNQVFDVSSMDLAGKQPVQLRSFYLTNSGKKVTPFKEQTLKTAIDPKQNRAAESQLFGYEALAKGQVFRFALQADAHVSDALWNQLVESLQGMAHLGRSRSAQFGRVEIKSTKETYVTQQKIKSKVLNLWLLSDLYLYEQGANTLVPTSEALGLPQGTKWLKDKSFIRSRRYSIYNAYRKHYDKERQVISRGSVLRYELPESFTDYDALTQQLSNGIGLSIESGLGQVAINPTLLANTHPSFDEVIPLITSIKQRVVAQPKSLLISTLLHRQKSHDFGAKPRQIAQEIFAELCEKVRFARSYHAMARGTAFDAGKIPTRTQFGRFKEFANQYRNNSKALWQELTNATNGMLNIQTEQEQTNRQSGASYHRGGWQLKFGLGQQDTLGDYLKLLLVEHQDKDYFSQIIGELAVFGLSDEWEKYSLGTEKQQEEVV